MGKKGKFGLGLLLGAIGGALAGILYAPKAGKETREEAAKKIKELQKKFSDAEIERKVKTIFGKVTEETKDIYLNASKAVLERVADLKKRAGKIDRKKYQKLVDDVVSDVTASAKHSAKTLKLLKDNLVSDWKDFVTAGPKRKSNGSRKK